MLPVRIPKFQGIRRSHAIKSQSIPEIIVCWIEANEFMNGCWSRKLNCLGRMQCTSFDSIRFIFMHAGVSCVYFIDFNSNILNIVSVRSENEIAYPTIPEANSLHKIRKYDRQFQADPLRDACLPKMLCEIAAKPASAISEKEKSLLELIKWVLIRCLSLLLALFLARAPATRKCIYEYVNSDEYWFDSNEFRLNVLFISRIWTSLPAKFRLNNLWISVIAEILL